MLVENNSGELFIIEMQNNPQVDYFLRMLYGVSKAITEYISLGEGYDKVRKVYHINILYFRTGDGTDYVYFGGTEFRGIHSNKVLALTQKQKDFFRRENVQDLFPAYFLLCVDDFDDIAKDSLGEWMYYLKHTEIPETFTAQGLKEVKEKCMYDNLSEDEKRSYVYHLDQVRYEQDVVDDSYDNGRADGKAEGILEGRAEGKAEGRAEGILEGITKGKVEGRVEGKVEVVIKSYHANLSVEIISTITELSIEEVREILNKQGLL